MGTKGTQHDRKGKRLKKQSVGLANFEVTIPDVNTFKSVQVRISGWIKPNPEADQIDYDRAMASTKFRLKKMIREWSDTYKFYQPETIIDIDTTQISNKTRKSPHQFFKLDIVLFTRDEMSFDKYFVIQTTDDIVERSMVILDEYPEFWNFTINENWTRRRRKVDV